MEFRKDQIQQSYDAGLGLPDKTKQLIADQERDDGAEDGHGGQWNDEGWSGGWWTYEGWNGGWWTNEGWNGGWWSGGWWDQAEEADDADDWTLWRPKNDDGDGDWRGDDWRQDDGDGDWHGGQWDDEGWKGGWWDQAVEEPVLSTDSETEEEAHRRRSGGRGSAGGDQGIAQFNADDLTSGNAEKMLKKFEKRISDHQVPRCEVCTRETYALACRTCGLRICASCELDGSQCVCYYWRDRERVSARTRCVSRSRLGKDEGALLRMLFELLCFIVVGIALTDSMTVRKRFSGHNFIDPPRRPPPPYSRCFICGEFARVPYRYCWFCGDSPSWHHGRCCPVRASDHEQFMMYCEHDNEDLVRQ